jgi:hypothetical protein
MATTPVPPKAPAHVPAKPQTPPQASVEAKAAAPAADPQEVKLNPPTPAPPRWDETLAAPADPPKDTTQWSPAPSTHAQDDGDDWRKHYTDGMLLDDEQRARSQWLESHGMAAWFDKMDERPISERPAFDKDALAGGGAYVRAGAQKIVPGVGQTSKQGEGEVNITHVQVSR